MKPLLFIGVILIVFGVLGLAVGRFSYVEKKTFGRVGGVQIEAKAPRLVEIPREACFAAMGAGALLVASGVALGARQRRH